MALPKLYTFSIQKQLKLTRNHRQGVSAEPIGINSGAVCIIRIWNDDKIRGTILSHHHGKLRSNDIRVGFSISRNRERSRRTLAPDDRTIAGNHCYADAVVFVHELSGAGCAVDGEVVAGRGAVVEACHCAGRSSVVHQTPGRC